MAGRVDLWAGLIVLWVIAGGLAVGTVRRFRLQGQGIIGMCAIGTTGLILVSWFWVRDSWWVVSWLPFAGTALLAGQCQVALGGILAGALWLQKVLPAWRRILLIVVLEGFLSWPAVAMIAARPPVCTAAWEGDVCLQTDSSTCTAAASATLLQTRGISASEAEMADLCLTDSRGTSPAGLVRGLNRRCEGHPVTLRVGSMTLDELSRFDDFPILLEVGLTREVNARDPRYAQRWGWPVGQRHSVVLYGVRSDGFVEMGDPAIGRELWRMEGLADLWNGNYVALEPWGGE